MVMRPQWGKYPKPLEKCFLCSNPRVGKLFCQEPDRKYSRPWEPWGSLSQLFLLAAVMSMQYLNERMWLRSNKTFLTRHAVGLIWPLSHSFLPLWSFRKEVLYGSSYGTCSYETEYFKNVPCSMIKLALDKRPCTKYSDFFTWGWSMWTAGGQTADYLHHNQLGGAVLLNRASPMFPDTWREAFWNRLLAQPPLPSSSICCLR